MNNQPENILKNNDPKSLISKLSPEEKQLLDSLMRDPAAREKFLSGEQAQKIIKMMGGR